MWKAAKTHAKGVSSVPRPWCQHGFAVSCLRLWRALCVWKPLASHLDLSRQCALPPAGLLASYEDLLEAEQAALLASALPSMPPAWRAEVARQTGARAQAPTGFGAVVACGRFHGPRAALVGDAAHAVTSTLGQARRVSSSLCLLHLNTSRLRSGEPGERREGLSFAGSRKHHVGTRWLGSAQGSSTLAEGGAWKARPCPAGLQPGAGELPRAGRASCEL